MLNSRKDFKEIYQFSIFNKKLCPLELDGHVYNFMSLFSTGVVWKIW